jgi:hypothetical protein
LPCNVSYFSSACKAPEHRLFFHWPNNYVPSHSLQRTRHACWYVNGATNCSTITSHWPNSWDMLILLILLASSTF